MDTVKISPKYQVVIPKDVRQSMGLRPGDQFEITASEGIVELIPILRQSSPPAREDRGRKREPK